MTAQERTLGSRRTDGQSSPPRRRRIVRLVLLSLVALLVLAVVTLKILATFAPHFLYRLTCSPGCDLPG